MTDFWRCAWAFWRRDAALAVSYPLAFAFSWFGIVARVVALWLPAQLLVGSELFSQHGGFLPYAVVGTSVMGFFMTSYGGIAGAVRSEQAMGTLESVLMTPAPVFAIVLGSVSWTLTQALLDACLMLAAAALIYDLAFQGSPLMALLVIVLTNLSFLGIGMMSGAFTVVFKRGDPFRPFVAGASFLLGGVVYPTDVLPAWLQSAAELLPVTHGARALRAVVLEGQSLPLTHPDILVLAAFALVLLPGGVIGFRIAISKAQRDGSLLHY